TCKVGLVTPNSPEEKVVLIKKGDAIPISAGTISWWFNGGDTDVLIVFLGDTSKALVPGSFTYFFVGGVLGLLAGFQADFIGKAFGLQKKESESLVSSQPGALLVKLQNGIEFPEPSKHIKEKHYATIDDPSCDVIVEGGGFVNTLTEKNFPMLADGSLQINYVVKGSGQIRVVGSEGKPALDNKVEEGDLFIVPQYFATAEVADAGGMDVFSIITSSKPNFGQLAGNTSVWKALSPVVLQSSLNITKESEELFKSKNTKNVTVVPSTT
nr:11-S seed storage protein, plant [Tanacetum cinerariifolium]